jgi:hypothetical protein
MMMTMTGVFFHRKCSEESSMINGKVNLTIPMEGSLLLFEKMIR